MNLNLNSKLKMPACWTGRQNSKRLYFFNFLIPVFIFSFLIFTFELKAGARNIGYADDPLEIGIGARSMAMGRAFVAATNCVNSVFNNPAAMSDNPSFTFTTMVGKLLGDVSYNVISYTTPLSIGKIKGTLGLGYLTSDIGPIITPTQSGFSQFSYSSTIKILSFTEKNLGPWKSMSMGGRLKLFDRGFSGSVNYSGNGMDLDLGFLHAPDSKTSFGLELKNVLPTSLGGKITYPNGDEESLAAGYRIGVSSRHLNPNLMLALDYDSYFYRNLPATWHLGIEYKVGTSLILRGGFDQTESAGNVTTNPTYGIGLIVDPSFRVSYAYHPYTDNSNYFNQYLSIVYEPFYKKEAPITKEISPEAQPVVIPPSKQISPPPTPARITLPLPSKEVEAVIIVPPPTRPLIVKPKTITVATKELAAKVIRKIPIKPLSFYTLKIGSETYKVKPGDTLSSIVSRHYRLTRPADIDEATRVVAIYNNIEDPDKLTLSEIKLPKIKALKKGEKFPALEKIIGGETYTIKPGDNLYWIISRHYGLSDPEQISRTIDIIGQINRLDTNRIPAGQKISLPEKAELLKALQATTEIPVTEKPLVFSVPINLKENYSYRVRRGETLSRIVAKTYRLTSPKQIAAMTEIVAKINNLPNPDVLTKDQVLLPKLGKMLPGIKPQELDGLFESKSYTVRREDLYQGIYGIVARYYELKDPRVITQVAKFVGRANEVEPLLLHEGQKLNLPTKETIQNILLGRKLR